MQGGAVALEFEANLHAPHGKVHASTFIRERRIVMDAALLRRRRELRRILVHELFHFVWVRLGNRRRREFEELIAGEHARRARGELGWSAEWRKKALKLQDRAGRTRRWREYVCESFCDTAAWRWAGLKAHGEFTLASRFRLRRRRWMKDLEAAGALPI